MVSVINKELYNIDLSNKEHLGWHLITQTLQDTVDAGIQSFGRSSETPDHKNQQPSDSLQIEINGESEDPIEGPKSPEPEWMITVKEKLDLAQKDEVAAGTLGKLCIYRVSRYLRDGEDKTCTPNIVSLGPYHRGRKRLRPMDRHKWRAFNKILRRGNQDAKYYFDSIKTLEDRARACYEGQITISSNEFVEMMVLDGCFVIELFRGAAVGFTKLGYSACDPVFAMRGSMHLIQRDMIMLENQIPLFILDRLHGLQFRQPNQKGLVANMALRFLEPLTPTEPLTESSPKRILVNPNLYHPMYNQNYLHCLHVFRQSLLRAGPQEEMQSWNLKAADKRTAQLIHCVTQLKEAGIKFKKRKTHCFWDIKFKNGVLEIPPLIINDGTKSLFLNLIAFEQSHLGCGNKITSYVIFMDNLINSQEDVAYLHYCGIFEHWLGSDADVADMFNQLWQDVVFDRDNSYLSGLSQQVHRFYSHRWNTWRASLMHNYFSNPWAIISLFAAVILLILTAAQTFYGAYGFYTPPS